MYNDIESRQVSLIDLLTNHHIERIVIPIIQRDYAQGRVNEQDVRDNFLDSLKNYLEDPLNGSHDLDFVYGNINSDNEFIPLDGQQRLTTLFLLHYYLSIKDECYESFKKSFLMKDSSPRFIYQTRNSSSDFCKALINNPLSIADLDNVSGTIKQKCPWYTSSWSNDPTVSSMLNMLDSISIRFINTQGLYARLADVQSPAITFRVLFMQQSGLKDDLYIKMNSRGLELSPFENLKARIIQKLKSYKEKTFVLQRSKTKNPEFVTPKDYFSFKMDIDWSDLFWIYKQKRSRQTDEGEDYEIWDIDTSLLNFISTIALNYKALSNNVNNDDLTNYENLKWKFYSELDEKFYLHLIDVFDLFYMNAHLDDSETKGIHDMLDGISKFKIRETFTNFLNKNYKDAAYNEHIRFFAYYEYLIHHNANYDQEDFRQWMRIIMNLTTNSSWQDVSEFCRAMRTIQWLVKNNTKGIIELMAEGRHDFRSAGFSPMQFYEERVKAKLLYSSQASEWKNRIESAEENGYFRGQILCLLNFCGVEDDINNYKSWNNDEANKYIDSFDKYIKLLWLVFDEKGLRDELKEKQIFRRALLSYGAYCMPIGYYRYSFIIDQSRDYSWRRYLQTENEDSSKKRRSYFKQLLDNYDNNIAFTHYLQECINKNIVNVKEWRSLMIDEPSLWDQFGNDLFACFANSDHDVYILNTKTMGGRHCELRSIYLFHKLPNKKWEDYQWSQNWETFPSLNYTNNKGDVFNLQFINNQWLISYIVPEVSALNTRSHELESLGFVLSVDNTYELNAPEIDTTFLDSLNF